MHSTEQERQRLEEPFLQDVYVGLADSVHQKLGWATFFWMKNFFAKKCYFRAAKIIHSIQPQFTSSFNQKIQRRGEILKMSKCFFRHFQPGTSCFKIHV